MSSESPSELIDLKVKCPICGIEGFLEQRGNNCRIKHYVGYDGNQRKYLMHAIGKDCFDTVGISAENGNQYMGINLKDSSLNSESKRGCRLVWSRLGDLGSLDPGSNPGSPTCSTFEQSQARLDDNRN